MKCMINLLLTDKLSVRFENYFWRRQNFSVYLPSSHPNYTSGGINAGEPSFPERIKIAMLCLRIILRDESQAVGNSPLA